MINCEHVIVQRVISLFFPSYILANHTNECTQDGINKLCTHYIKDFPRFDCTRNMSEDKSTARQGLIFVEILPLHVLPLCPLQK